MREWEGGVEAGADGRPAFVGPHRHPSWFKVEGSGPFSGGAVRCGCVDCKRMPVLAEGEAGGPYEWPGGGK